MLLKINWWLLLLLISTLVLAACQTSTNGSGELKEADSKEEMAIDENEFAISKEVTEIEVLTWDGDQYVTSIEDELLIEDLVYALENAEINYTGNVDWAGPDYKLLFKHEEEVLYEIGYCNTIQNFESGTTGRYWEFDRLYKVDIELPIE